MDAVIKTKFQVFRFLVHEGRHQEGYGTDVMHRIAAAIGSRKDGSGFFGVKFKFWDGHHGFPMGGNVDAFSSDFSFFQKGHAEAP